jgi:hypothetical protein
MLRAAVESCITGKERCAASRTSRYMACVMCASSSPCYQEAARPVPRRLDGRVCDEEDSRRGGRCSDGGVPRHRRWKVAGTRSQETTTRAERASRADVRADRMPWLSGCSSLRCCCHISSDTHRQPLYHNIFDIWRLQASRSAISIPFHTTTRRLGTLSDWRQERWAKSGTLMTISEYRGVHDQTTRSNGRTQQCKVFRARMQS